MKNKKELIREYFSELGKKSAEARIKRMGADGFSDFMRKIGEKGKKTRWGEKKEII